MPIKRITIAGFRGILAPLHLDLAAGAQPVSIIVSGRNGTGKSSVVDAWEWFWSNQIEHLAREGAGPSSYAHRESVDGDTYVEIEFAAEEIGTIRRIFHHDRPTLPTTVGNMAAFKARTPHPCHIRFGDLTRFVYLRKAERYDLLSHLMGFERQVELQKCLRRVEKELARELEALRERLKLVAKELRAAIPVDHLTEMGVLSSANVVLCRHGLLPATTLSELRARSGRLKDMVERDPQADRLARLTNLGKQIRISGVPTTLVPAVSAYAAVVQPFKAQEETFKKLLMIDLYRQGIQVISGLGDTGRCPLCGKSYEGDLREHIHRELVGLKELREVHEAVEEKRKLAATALQTPFATAPIREALHKIESRETRDMSETLLASLEALDGQRASLLGKLSMPSQQLDSDSLTELRTAVEEFTEALRSFDAKRNEIIQHLAKEVRRLRADSTRVRLMEDDRSVAALLNSWDQCKRTAAEGVALKQVNDQYSAIVSAFVRSSAADVGKRFDDISNNLSTYFAILEERTPRIERPVLRLLIDQDRAVVPEVTFYGATVSPAYRYLSESQLCSFGLAVFLAAVRHLNPDFRLLILDDVINSLDGYKRPQLIRLLREHFSDYQVVLTTHDSAWRDRLYKAFPSWHRVQFIRFDYGIGPVCAHGLQTLDEVKQLINQDKPRLAGQALGPYLEFELQEICEAFEVELKYNRRNEYTLDPLLDRLRVRVQKKLGATHPLTTALKELYEESGFRNLCSHAKDPAIQLTPEELELAVEKWQAVELHVRCQTANCAAVLQYTSAGAFKCPCGRSVLVR